MAEAVMICGFVAVINSWRQELAEEWSKAAMV
jgi:hypothetical protein